MEFAIQHTLSSKDIKLMRKRLEWVEELQIPTKIYPLRLFYYYKENLCTVIDVNEPTRKIAIKNFVRNPIYCAFGVNNAPTFKDYEDFLESRCFPRSRDKMKIILRDLGLPFYDPFLIIQKTKGKMAEDDFWIEIER